MNVLLTTCRIIQNYTCVKLAASCITVNQVFIDIANIIAIKNRASNVAVVIVNFIKKDIIIRIF